MPQFFKKVPIEAIQYLGSNLNEVAEFTNNKAVKEVSSSRLNIGELTCDFSDFITKESENGNTVFKVFRINIFQQNHIII